MTVLNDGNGTGYAKPAKAEAGTGYSKLAKVEAGTGIMLKAIPNEGYRFKEWEVVSGGITIEIDVYTTMPSNDVTIKAIFEEIPPKVLGVNISPKNTPVQKGTSQTFYVTVTGSHSFDNTVSWNVYGGTSGTYIDSTGKLTIDAGETAETITVTATSDQDSWKKDTAIVTVTDALKIKNAATVINGTGSGEYAESATVSITANPAAEIGIAFDKWISADVSFDDEYAEATKFTMPGKAVTIEATYVERSYTVIFIDHNGIVLDTQTVKHGDRATPPAIPERTGYTARTWDKVIDNVTSDLTATPNYKANLYTITFNSDGGSFETVSTQEYGQVPFIPKEPTKEGYTFNGWDPEIPATVPAEDITLTAQWLPIDYKVTVINGTAEPTANVGDTVTITANEPEAGKVFDKWTGSLDFDDEYAEATTFTMPANAVTVTATYKEID